MTGQPAACAASVISCRVRCQQPRVEHPVEDLPRLWPHERVGPGEEGAQLVVVQYLEHLAELLGGHHHGHVAVGAGQDTQRKHGCAALGHHLRGKFTVPVLPSEMKRHLGRVGRQRLRGGTVDERTGPRGTGPQDGSQGAHGGGVADGALTHRRRQLHGAEGVSEERAGECLHDEVAPGEAGVGPGCAKTAERGDTEPWALLQQLSALDAPVGQRAQSRGLHDEVGVVEHPPQLAGGVAGAPEHEAALVGVQVGEGPPIGAHGVALRRLQLDDLCPEVREHLAAPGGCHPGSDLDDGDIAEGLTHQPGLSVLDPARRATR